MGFDDDGSTMDRSGRSIDLDPNPSVSTTRRDAMRDDATRRDARSIRLSLSLAIDGDGDDDGDAVDRARTRVGARTRDTGVSTIDAQTDLMSPDSSIGGNGGGRGRA